MLMFTPKNARGSNHYEAKCTIRKYPLNEFSLAYQNQKKCPKYASTYMYLRKEFLQQFLLISLLCLQGSLRLLCARMNIGVCSWNFNHVSNLAMYKYFGIFMDVSFQVSNEYIKTSCIFVEPDILEAKLIKILSFKQLIQHQKLLLLD